MAELGVFIGVLGGVLTSIILTVQKSKCETIDCCGIKCKRRIEEKKSTPVPPPPAGEGDEVAGGIPVPNP